jgi:hypothetical protein
MAIGPSMTSKQRCHLEAGWWLRAKLFDRADAIKAEGKIDDAQELRGDLLLSLWAELDEAEDRQ